MSSQSVNYSRRRFGGSDEDYLARHPWKVGERFHMKPPASRSPAGFEGTITKFTANGRGDVTVFFSTEMGTAGCFFAKDLSCAERLSAWEARR